MIKGHNYEPMELSMRIVLWMTELPKESIALAELCQRMRDKFGMSRAQAYRYAACAIYVLDLTEEHTPRPKAGNARTVLPLEERKKRVRYLDRIYFANRAEKKVRSTVGRVSP